VFEASGTVVLDSEGLSKLAVGDDRARAYLDSARARVAASAITLTETPRGGPRDAALHRVLSRITVVPVTAQIARQAGELLGAAGLSGHRCAIDAVVAATALGLERPIVLLTSDPDDVNRLVEPAGHDGAIDPHRARLPPDAAQGQGGDTGGRDPPPAAARPRRGPLPGRGRDNAGLRDASWDM
jgi:predicted nucleic acid-binding protein